MEHEVILTDEQLADIDLVFTLFRENIPEKILQQTREYGENWTKWNKKFRDIRVLHAFFRTIRHGEGE